MPDLHNRSSSNEDHSDCEDENVSPIVPLASTATKKKTTVSTRDDLNIIASPSSSPTSSPRIAARKPTKHVTRPITRKNAQDDDGSTSEEEDGYVAMALPVITSFI